MMTVVLTPRGLPVTTCSAALADALHCFEEEVLDYGSQAAALFDALPLDPECALATSYAAALHLFRGTRDGHDRASPLAANALNLAAGSVRETQLTVAIERWAAGDVASATAILAAWVSQEPTDLFAGKLLQHLLFSTGNVAAMLESMTPIAAAVPREPRVLGMLAFALDQTGLTREAEGAARAALEIAPDPWAHHALAHVLDAERRYEEGQAWMRAHSGAWANCTSFLYTHNWWHAALFHLALGDTEGALALYHDRIWAVRKDYVQDQVNAVSLLARLELAGVDVDDRWEDVATYIRPRRADALDGFLDLHYAYALARSGDRQAVDELLAALAHAAASGQRSRRIALDAADGLASFAFGDHVRASQRLGAVAKDLHLLGGSTVQRRLFGTILDCARAGTRHLFKCAA
ncbi:tetratricopeptide repeat protein [Novosphingobium sp. FGD1]|uniref:Tetratricopeptide repeat protein 38 n=1 Tax=Novosphingobium silvae TaxID=2692619 RepID=A0A7X4K9A1_9SPHN|nr:tetratricopeptide repeat protein [Novosphingobium silvae]MYL99877.1 tetratricopeptide repeat protein [Novosphingobium silvae]